MFNRKDYVSDKDWQNFLEFSKDLETPNIVINVNTVKQNYIKLHCVDVDNNVWCFNVNTVKLDVILLH